MLRRILVAATVVLAAMTATVAVATPAGASAPAAETQLAGPCPYDGDHPTLRQGNTGSAVAHLQCLLRKVWGYTTVGIDSQFGPITRSGVIAHQRDCGIVADGVVGPDTWRHLHPDTTTAACLD